jgi:hypoxanthine phosphoribosyltransferase
MLFDYNMFDQAIKSFSNRINTLGIKYAAVVGICRGGLIPATALSYKLKVPMQVITISLRDRNVVDLPQAFYDLVETGQPILVVDDIIDSGDTLTILKQRLIEKGLSPDNIDVASLVYNSKQEHKCRYYFIAIDRSINKQWISFFWDNGGFHEPAQSNNFSENQGTLTQKEQALLRK